MSGVVDDLFYQYCGGCLVWWMFGVVDVRCDGCLVWWMSCFTHGVMDVWCGVDVCVVDVLQSMLPAHRQGCDYVGNNIKFAVSENFETWQKQYLNYAHTSFIAEDGF